MHGHGPRLLGRDDFELGLQPLPLGVDPPTLGLDPPTLGDEPLPVDLIKLDEDARCDQPGVGVANAVNECRRRDGNGVRPEEVQSIEFNAEPLPIVPEPIILGEEPIVLAAEPLPLNPEPLYLDVELRNPGV